MEENSVERAKRLIEYHNRTKHHPHRYAASPGGLDWSTQPDPFRRYSGADLIQLPLLAADPAVPYARLFDRAGIEPAPFTVERVAAFLELSLGLSAWKSYGGGSWALRMNPSSGNLHPTEGYVVLPPSAAGGGVFHYNPYLHALERRASFDEPFWSALRDGLGADGFLAGLSSIYWRESWKYGERAFRYCNLDLGHAIAAMSLSAALQGWRVTYLESLASRDVSTVLGFDRTEWRELEAEDPECLLLVHRVGEDPVAGFDPEEVVKPFAGLAFSGVPEPLSPGHVDWEVIYRAAELSEKPRTPLSPQAAPPSPPPYAPGPAEDLTAAAVIRKRRSGQAYDGATPVAMADFLAMLARTTPVAGRPPFDAGFYRSNVHLLLFVHRVTGLAPGLYVFLRGDDLERKRALERLKRDFHPGFSWAPATPDRPEVPLHLLEEGDVTGLARDVSCRQEIAGDGAFSVGMLAAFRENIERAPYMYRRLHWEAGMIGQALYLESEARGLGGTGIGCFFDDMVHEGLGLAGDSFQTIYHFTVGAPLVDERITTLPPYHHLERGTSGAGP